MARPLLRRAGFMALTLFGVAVVVFVLLRVAPGDPIAMMIGPGASAADVAGLRAHYGLDKSMTLQFAIWLGTLLRGDFGTSISLRRDVLGLIGERLPATLELAVAALAVALLFAVVLATIGTLFRRRAGELAVDGATGLMLAVPDFVWALVLVLLFGVALSVLPLSGRIDPSLDARFRTPFYLVESLVTGRWRLAEDLAAHLVMPVLALALPLAAVVARVLKGALAEAMVQDYVLLARVKGMTELRIVLGEALRNAMGPTLALTGVQFTFLLGGTVIVERIFAYPGLGNMAIEAVINRDLPLIQGLVLVFGFLFVLTNLAVDLAIAGLNPGCAMGERDLALPRAVEPALRAVPHRSAAPKALRDPKLLGGGGFILLLAAMAILAPLLAPHDPLEQDLMAATLPPFGFAGTDPTHVLGTDDLGRDVLSRLIFGTRIALTVAAAAAGAAALVGTLLGLISGYFGGWVDVVVSRLIEIWMAFPAVLLSILIVAILGPGLGSVILAIALIDWTRFARVIRAETQAQAAADYVTAARVLGLSRWAILFREILPNVVPVLVGLVALEMGIAVVVEAILSFVGLSLSSDTPTWGGMIAAGRQIIYQAWWVIAAPLAAVFLTVLAFNQLGDGLRRAIDPVLRR